MSARAVSCCCCWLGGDQDALSPDPGEGGGEDLFDKRTSSAEQEDNLPKEQEDRKERRMIWPRDSWRPVFEKLPRQFRRTAGAALS